MSVEGVGVRGVEGLKLKVFMHRYLHKNSARMQYTINEKPLMGIGTLV
jgi:hypothetical protein